MLLVLLFAGLAGCGLGMAPRPSLGVISVTDPLGVTHGQLSSLVVDGTANVSVSIANDQNLGIDWSVTCAGSQTPNQPGSICGTVAPVHTAGGIITTYTAPADVPLSTNVTITATSTADPSQSTSAQIAIQQLPITLALTPAPPASLTVGSIAYLIANVTNDSTDQGVVWTTNCSSSSCGTFVSGNTIANQTASGQQIVYTAPSNPTTVTITATSVADSTKSTTAVINIIPVTVTLSITAFSVATSGTYLLSATATDSGAQGVDWSVSCNGGNCGSITSHTSNNVPATYTAPSQLPTGGTVTITAASTAFPSAVSTATATILPISITVAPSRVGLSQTAQLVAVVSNTLPNTDVNWSCTPTASCGSFSPAQTASNAATTYTAPANIPSPNPITVTATAVANASDSTSVLVTITAPITIAFTQAPTSPATTGVNQSLSATVTNDLTPGGVDWSCIPTGACGIFTPAHTSSGAVTIYTPPLVVPQGAVTISATSTANTSQQVNKTITIVASTVTAVSFYPSAPSSLLAGSTVPVNLIAVVANDATYAGVDWSVCSSAATCGQFLVTPAQPPTPKNGNQTIPAVYSNTVHTASGIAGIYIPPTQVANPATVTITAASHAKPTAAATATPTVATANTGVALSGHVLSGNLPLVGAHVAVYAAGTTGYSSAATLLSPGSGYVVTDSNGNFIIPGTYTCPAQSSQIYLLATAGNVSGYGVNSQISLMTALGSCNSLSSTPVVINEVTTVASIWPLQQFMADDTHVGSSSTNAYSGLFNAFASVNNLVDINTGGALSLTIPGNGTAPQATVDSLSSILANCIRSAGGSVGDGTPCGNLFYASNTTYSTVTAPKDTVQAAINIAQNQGVLGSNAATTTNIFALQPASPVYTPALSVAPNDWTLSLTFVGGGLVKSGGGYSPASSALAIDASGDAWVTNARIPSVTELSPIGAPLSPWTTDTSKTLAGGFKDSSISSPYAIAIDLLGDVWVGNSNGSLTELTYAGADMSGNGGYTGGGLGGTVGLAIDSGNAVTSPGGNVWAVSTGASSVTQINGSTGAATQYTPTIGGNNVIGSTSGAIAIDGAGAVWVGDAGNGTMIEFGQLTGSLLGTDDGSVSTVTPPLPTQLNNGVSANIAIDGSGASGTGNIWVPGNPSSTAVAELYASGIGGATYTPNILSNPGPIAIDGSGHVWMSTSGANGPPAIPPGELELSSSGSLLIPYGYTNSYLINGVTAMAIDGSGNLWTLTGGNYSTLTEFLGIASPVVTPISIAAESNKLGKRP